MVASTPVSGPYDDPSYLTRQQINLGTTTAGANGTSGGQAFISDMRIRKATAVVRTAGTSSGATNAMVLMVLGTYVTGYGTAGGFSLTTGSGTNALTTFALGSSAALSVVTSTDMNTKINAGSVLFLKNATDATGVAHMTVEAYLDSQATYTGPNN